MTKLSADDKRTGRLRLLENAHERNEDTRYLKYDVGVVQLVTHPDGTTAIWVDDQVVPDSDAWIAAFIETGQPTASDIVIATSMFVFSHLYKDPVLDGRSRPETGIWFPNKTDKRPWDDETSAAE
jgi:hypothetical protein